MSGAYKKIDDLSPEERRALLARLMQSKSAEPRQFPLSFPQERLWLLDQMEPGGVALNIRAAVRLMGRLDVAALEQALNEVIRRHEALRTTFAVRDGQPVQVVSPSLPLRLPVAQTRPASQPEREAQAMRIIEEEAQRPFDLARGPLLRAALIRLAGDDHVVLLTMHHIISDGWSVGVLIREVAALYATFSTRQPSPLAELPIQYADFAQWQRRWLQGEALNKLVSYWTERLLGATTILQLPADRPRPPVQTFDGGREVLTLPQALLASLEAFSRQQGVTLFMTMLAAFKVLLYRYTGQEDICVGTFIANRNQRETEGLVGFFVNNLVLRTDLSGAPDFVALLERIHQTTSGAYAHQDLPFEKLLEALQVERDPGRTPLFQVMFVLQNAPMPALNLPGLTASPIKFESKRANFDMTLWLDREGEDLLATAEYNSDLFDAATVARLLKHYRQVLESAVESPQSRIAVLTLLTDQEQRQILCEWNQAPLPGAISQRIHDFFESQAERAPGAVAVTDQTRRLNYGELNARANQLARFLRALGVRPEATVGICMDRSVELLVAILGVLKAGGAYLPLDPAHSKARTSFMLKDARAAVLLTRQGLVNAGDGGGIRVVRLDAESDLISKESPENLSGGALPENLAYAIYTSGSTGKPKGVMITHANLVNAYLAWEDAYGLRSGCVSHLQMASFSFDVFSGDWVRALCSGGKLVLCPQEWLLEPDRVYELMRREAVDCAEFVPVVARGLIQYLQASRQSLDFMRVLIVGSDVWYVREFNDAARFCGDQTRLINSYGLTEATIDSSYFENAALNLLPDRLVPIGKPFKGTQIYLLDPRMQLVPVGVVGQVFIGGGLARGYLERPELTAERFVPNPFSQEPGTRLYQTGDLARYLPNGDIDFIGRADNQVKVRGYRIELGEIEAALGDITGTKDVVVLARDDGSGDKRLVAYVASMQGGQPEIREVRNALKERLPEFMIPSVFVTLEALPLTSNGKVDRRALPAPDWTGTELRKEYVAPRTPIEEVLAEIWANVLKLDQVGVQDNFFEIGGYSLLAAQLVSQARHTFEIDLPLRAIFETPTVEEMSLVIEERLLDEIDRLPEEEAQL